MKQDATAPPESEASHTALADFYAATYSRLLAVLTVAAGDHREAEEVVQEAFIRLVPRWQAISRYQDPEAWVRQVAFRLLSNRFRQLRRARAALGRIEGATTSPEPSLLAMDVARALAALPVAQRQVVVLHHLVGLPLERVAQELRVPMGTVKSRLNRARAALAPLLTEEQP
ncbi:MAG: polymerase, sigma-24 subunit, subfamily [Frankiales bacterium]|nr:polymerase, sigma-24 subunit, subfamily [Frankiales bacterium]